MRNPLLRTHARCWPIAAWALASGLACAQTPYADRQIPGVAVATWLTPDGKPKDFARYIQDTQALVAERHYEMPPGSPPIPGGETLAEAIGPRAWPLQGQNYSPDNTDGILLVHGLTDSPYLMRDLGDELARQPITPGRCVQVRSLLLPGHATRPGDLVQTGYAQWLAAVGYGISSFADVAAQVHLVGFSTGGALGIYWAYQQKAAPLAAPLASLVLLSPAIEPVNWKARLPVLPSLTDKFSALTGWLRWQDTHLDQDFAKYESFALHAGVQISLVDDILKGQLKTPIPLPVYMALSFSDSTIAARDSITAFIHTTDPRNRMLLAANSADAAAIKEDPLQRITVVPASLPGLAVRDFSHTAWPVKPGNLHYGSKGSYADCKHYAKDTEQFCACSTQAMQVAACTTRATSAVLYGELPTKGLPQNLADGTLLRRLSFNPYFDRMAGEIRAFLSNVVAP